MRAASIFCCLLVSAAAGQGQPVSDLTPFDRGVLGVIFNQSPRLAEKMLRSAIGSGHSSKQAYEAYEWLSHLYYYRGQYRSLVSTMERRWVDFPNKPEEQQERRLMAGFRGLPDQTLVNAKASAVHHESGSIFLPLSIDGKAATYFFDTGAWLSAMSESEAKRLGLNMRDTSATLGNSSGTSVGFRTAVARDLVVGETHLKNVSFAVFPDDQEPWSTLPRGRRGLLGIPILVAFGRLRWNRAGTAEIGNKPDPFDIRRSNLTFDNDHLVVTATVEGREIRATLDTGAETTDLYKPFADAFASLLRQKGKFSIP